jgi:pimeloyl-ACP methyl ester carboxylesterase
MASPDYHFVENESCTLRYWSQGTGPLIFFIPGGNGHGSQFNNIISFLSSKYTCATYDRRGMAGSPTTSPNILSPPQQARDVVAIIKALSFSKAIIFGNSLGGILSFQVAIDHPEICDHVIAHEAPTILILPDSSERFDRTLLLLSLYKEGGLVAAGAAFGSIFVGFDAPDLAAPLPPAPENTKNFFEKEFLIGSTYNPDWRKIVRNGVSVGVLAGERSKDAFYARTTIEQADLLGCLRWVVPGHHAAHEVETKYFAPKLVGFIEALEKKRAEKA